MTGVQTCALPIYEKIRQIKDEFMISIKAHEAASDGVVAPISFSEIDDKFLPHHIIELVYEYGGQDLDTALKNADGKKIMDAMESVVRIMAKFEQKQIFHSNIKPGNIVVFNGVVKLVDFGEAMVFDNKTQMLTTKTLRGGTISYLPPEVVKNLKGKLTAINGSLTALDVYCWGIPLYS